MMRPCLNIPLWRLVPAVLAMLCALPSCSKEEPAKPDTAKQAKQVESPPAKPADKPVDLPADRVTSGPAATTRPATVDDKHADKPEPKEEPPKTVSFASKLGLDVFKVDDTGAATKAGSTPGKELTLQGRWFVAPNKSPLTGKDLAALAAEGD